jgi:hypothetical protein
MPQCLLSDLLLHIDETAQPLRILGTAGLLKNAHLLCCAANRTAQRISIYASRFGFLRALHLNIFEQPQNMGFFNDPAVTSFPKGEKEQ